MASSSSSSSSSSSKPAPELPMKFKEDEDLNFDPYSVMWVQRNATQEEIKNVWKQLQKTEHPDKMRRAKVVNDAAAQKAYNRLKRAFEILGSPKRRLIYDKFGLEAVSKANEGILISLENSPLHPAELLQYFEQTQRLNQSLEYKSHVQPASDISLYLEVPHGPFQVPHLGRISGSTGFQRRLTDSTTLKFGGGLSYINDPWTAVPCIPSANIGIRKKLKRLSSTSKTTLGATVHVNPLGRVDLSANATHRIDSATCISGNIGLSKHRWGDLTEPTGQTESLTAAIRLDRNPTKNLTLFADIQNSFAFSASVPYIMAGFDYRDHMLMPRKRWSIGGAVIYRPFYTTLPHFTCSATYPFEHFVAQAEMAVDPESPYIVTKGGFTISRV